MVSTIWLSVSRRSDTAGMPDSWIFCRDWVRLLRNAPTLALDGLSARADRSVSTYFSVRATLMPCRTISFTAASLLSSVGSFRSARAWRSVSPASRAKLLLFRRQGQQPQFVGHRALAFAQKPRRLLLTHVPVLQQPGNAHGFLDEIQVLPLQIFHHGRHAGFPVVHAHDDAGDVRDPRQLRRPQTALPRDQLIAVSAPADGQRLQDSVLPDGIGQLVQRLRAENFPWLRRIGADGTSREKDHPSGLHVGFQLLTLHCPSSLVDVRPLYVASKREYQRKRRGFQRKRTTFSSLFYRSFPVHKIFTEYCIFPLAFFAKLRYYISTQSE